MMRLPATEKINASPKKSAAVSTALIKRNETENRWAKKQRKSNPTEYHSMDGSVPSDTPKTAFSSSFQYDVIPEYVFK